VQGEVDLEKWECQSALAKGPKSTLRNYRKPNAAIPKREWTRDAELTLRKLKKPIILQAGASGFAIAGILNQYGTLRLVNFYSEMFSSRTELRHIDYDRELLAICGDDEAMETLYRGGQSQDHGTVRS